MAQQMTIYENIYRDRITPLTSKEKYRLYLIKEGIVCYDQKEKEDRQ